MCESGRSLVDPSMSRLARLSPWRNALQRQHSRSLGDLQRILQDDEKESPDQNALAQATGARLKRWDDGGRKTKATDDRVNKNKNNDEDEDEDESDVDDDDASDPLSCLSARLRRHRVATRRAGELRAVARQLREEEDALASMQTELEDKIRAIKLEIEADEMRTMGLATDERRFDREELDGGLSHRQRVLDQFGLVYRSEVGLVGLYGREEADGYRDALNQMTQIVDAQEKQLEASGKEIEKLEKQIRTTAKSRGRSGKQKH